MNYKYAKILEDGTLSYAPKVLKIGKKYYFNPKEEHYNQCGYYKVVYVDYPTDNTQDYVTEYELVDNKIVQKWVLIEEV